MGPHVRDAGEPGPVRPVRAEIAANQVRRGAGLRRGGPPLPLGAPRASARRPGPAVLAHQARRALARGAHAGAPQLGEDLRGAVDAAAGGAYLGDLRRQCV